MPSHRRDAVAPRCLVDPFHRPIDTLRDRDNRQSVPMILGLRCVTHRPSEIDRSVSFRVFT
jgi:hypothetical protein